MQKPQIGQKLGAIRLFLINCFGWGFVALGVVLLPLPGPGSLLILTGLAILGLEYPWARKRMVQLAQWMDRTIRRLRGKVIEWFSGRFGKKSSQDLF